MCTMLYINPMQSYKRQSMVMLVMGDVVILLSSQLIQFYVAFYNLLHIKCGALIN